MIIDVCKGRAGYARQWGFRKEPKFQILELDGFMSFICQDVSSDMSKSYFVELSY